jgi:hypothetical protein
VILNGLPDALIAFWAHNPRSNAVDCSDDPSVVLWCAVAGMETVRHDPFAPRRFTVRDIARALLAIGEFGRVQHSGARVVDEVERAEVERAAAGLPLERWHHTDLTAALNGDRLGQSVAWHVYGRVRQGVTADQVREALAVAQGARRAA